MYVIPLENIRTGAAPSFSIGKILKTNKNKKTGIMVWCRHTKNQKIWKCAAAAAGAAVEFR